MPEIEIGLRIREKRKMKHYTRDVLANKVGISSKFLYEIETGRKNFSADILRRLAQELEVSCDYIMLGEKEEQHEAAQFLKKLEDLGPERLTRLQRLLDALDGMCDLDNGNLDNNTLDIDNPDNSDLNSGDLDSSDSDSGDLDSSDSDSGDLDSSDSDSGGLDSSDSGSVDLDSSDSDSGDLDNSDKG